jgi:hypothetical protein
MEYGIVVEEYKKGRDHMTKKEAKEPKRGEASSSLTTPCGESSWGSCENYLISSKSHATQNLPLGSTSYWFSHLSYHYTKDQASVT